ncbi:uncharacterized protein KY384_002041 [Bacidia gigantensis]|uniref:uncharacterized protein n=1 Tax=Bacidia gigantensis TaxID=2732470 RepID=UPI001D039C8B|nr:uncharacterized protein KY384_002041 [Bacidia gigantensis]KAG8533258.1 hypothetical protein KY384_002041 [Bacidia gigantensis]
MSHFDLLILGSGEAGKYLGWTLASTGKRTACVEQQYIGGSCPNIACLPSKNFIHSADIVYEASKAMQEGLFKADTSTVNMSVVRQRKRDMVDSLVEMHRGRFERSGCELISGHGRFGAPKEIIVEASNGSTRTLTADTIVISTGSRTRIPSIPGLASAKPLTHIEVLDLDVVPPHLAILGGGYIAVEFAQCMRRLGSQVTIFSNSAQILPREDEDVSSAIASILEKEGVQLQNAFKIVSVEGCSGEAVILTGSSHGATIKIEATHLLVATGRIPNTDDLGLQEAGISTTSDGYIDVDSHLHSTSTPSVFAVGDSAGSPHFTHVAYDDFRIVRDSLIGAGKRETLGRQVPYTLFTSPELARVGLTEAEAANKNIAYRLAKLPMQNFLKTRTINRTDGFAKALIGEDDQILGFAALGQGTGELLPVVQLAMKQGLPYTSIAELVLTHPTLSEGLVYLFSAVPASK